MLRLNTSLLLDRKELLHSLLKYIYYFKKDPLETGFPMEAKICEDPAEEKLLKSNVVSETEVKVGFTWLSVPLFPKFSTIGCNLFLLNYV